VTQVTDTGRNGVDTGRMFRATNRWIDGSHKPPNDQGLPSRGRGGYDPQ
jgi:hypothetical protein